MDQSKNDVVSITRIDKIEPEGPQYRPSTKRRAGRVLTGADLHLATLKSAKLSLEIFEMRFRGDRDLEGVVDLVKTARQVVTKLTIEAQRKTIKAV